MDKNQNEHNLTKDCDFLAWRVDNARRRENEHDKRLAYNLRPRLRRETGETIN